MVARWLGWLESDGSVCVTIVSNGQDSPEVLQDHVKAGHDHEHDGGGENNTESQRYRHGDQVICLPG